MIRYSIIIPHKNCIELLVRCVLSIPSRDDIEIIIVDDNSDNQIEIEKVISQLLNKNIKLVLSTKSGGGGYARNQGLKIASGQWLLFSDADDYFVNNAFDVFDKYSNGNDDIIFFKHKGVLSDTGEVVERSEYRNIIIDNYITSKNSKTEAFLRYNNAVPWAKMIRHSLVREFNIDFEEVPASNDTMFSTKVGHFAKSVKGVSDIVYIATVRNGSITHTKSRERYYSDYSVYVRRNRFLLNCGHPECRTRLFGLVVYAFVKYGVKEGFKYVRYAHQNKICWFYGTQQILTEMLKNEFEKLFKIFKCRGTK